MSGMRINCAWDEVSWSEGLRFTDARQVMTTHWRLNPTPIATYEAFDRGRDEPVWIRSYPDGYGVVEYEYSTLRGLQPSGSHIMCAHDMFLGPDYVAYSTERLNDRTLRTYLDRHEWLRARVGQFRRLLARLVRAVDAVHQCGIVHRDVRPENVFVPSEERVVLTGFAPEEQPRTCDWVFHEDIMFYEATDKTAAGDFYSIGAILLEFLAGGRGLGSHEARLEKLLTTGVAHKPQPSAISEWAPADLRHLCGAMLEPDPKNRPTATEILRGLEG